MDTLDQYLQFIRQAEGLKHTLRTAWAADGRQESTAEHSWRLALFAGLLSDEKPSLNKTRVLMLCLVHDLAEMYCGDVSAALRPDAKQKARAEAQGMAQACAPLPPKQRAALLSLWREYEAGCTPEARFVKALDKAETILQHNQGQNPPGFDYSFNLDYGAPLFCGDPLLDSLRQKLDEDTHARMQESTPGQTAR